MIFKCKVDGRKSFSATRLKTFLVGQLLTTDHFTQKDFHSYICFFFAFCKGSQFLEFVRPQGWLLFWIVIPFFLYILLWSAACCIPFEVFYTITVISLCIVWVFICRWLYYFQWINTKSFIFSVSLWFLSPFVICNVLCLRTKVLNSVAISWGCM